MIEYPPPYQPSAMKLLVIVFVTATITLFFWRGVGAFIDLLLRA